MSNIKNNKYEDLFKHSYEYSLGLRKDYPVFRPIDAHNIAKVAAEIYIKDNKTKK